MIQTLRPHPATVAARAMVRKRACTCKSQGGTLGDYVDINTLGDAGGSGANDPTLYGNGPNVAPLDPGFSWGGFFNSAGQILGGVAGAVAQGAAGAAQGIQGVAGPVRPPVPTSQTGAFNWGGATADILHAFGYGQGSAAPTLQIAPPQQSASLIAGVSTGTLLIVGGIAVAAIVLARRK
jgi:hypothetical protein